MGTHGGIGRGDITTAGTSLMSVGSASLRLVAGTLSTGYNTLSTAATAASNVVGEAANILGNDGMQSSSDQKEKVLWARFDTLEHGPRGIDGAAEAREVLLLGYSIGFQIWDVSDPGKVHELLSLRDVTVRCVQPLPAPQEPDAPSMPMAGQRPVLAIVPVGHGVTGKGEEAGPGPHAAPSPAPLQGSTIELYSAASQALVRILSFHSRVVSVRASPRILAVALETQVLGFDAGTLDKLFTAMTYPTPGSGPSPHEGHLWAAPLALGHRWLAYASNQSVQHPSGYATPHAPAGVSSCSAPGGSRHLHYSAGGMTTTAPGGAGGGASTLSTKDYMKTMASQAAAASGKQLKAGINWVGDAGYKLLSSQYASWTAGSSLANRRPSSDGDLSADHGTTTMGRSPDDAFGAFLGQGGPGAIDPLQAQVAGTVTVCDVMQRHMVVAHFRAHTSPLAMLAWDPSGLRLVTASVYGHSINVFQICPKLPNGADGCGAGGGAIHLYKLCRGMTPALITDAVFSSSGDWLAVSSGRGTTHVFRLGGEAGVAYGRRRPPIGSSPPPQHLNPVGRLRSTKGWTARVPGAPLAAAAAGLYTGGPGNAGPSVGAIAARFVTSDCNHGSASFKTASTSGRGVHPGHHSYHAEVLLAYDQAQPQPSTAGLPVEELLIAGPDGTLTRHLLGLSMAPDAVAGTHQAVGPEALSEDEGILFGSSPASMSSAFSLDGTDAETAELVSEVVSRLDVCRRLAWPEQGSLPPALDMKANNNPDPADDDHASTFPRVADTEEERHRFVANAEICLHPVRPPLWSSAPQFQFLEPQQHQQKQLTALSHFASRTGPTSTCNNSSC